MQTELALRGWVHDQVIGPEAVASIKAVGIVSGKDTISHQAKDFDKAFRRIRGIRTSIGRLLNVAIRQSFTSFGSSSDASTQSLDDRLRLPVNELIETLDFAEIGAVGSVTTMIAPQMVGRLYKSGGE